MRQINKKLLIPFIIILISESSFAQESEIKIVGPCNTEKEAPKPPNGMEKLVEWIKENHNRQQGQTTTSGRVYVKFSVDSSGNIFDVKIAKGLTDETNKEALRLVSNMPNRIPAEDNKAQCFMVLPILFPIPETGSNSR